MATPVEKDEQIKEVQSILDNFSDKTIDVLKGYIEYGELPEKTGFDTPDEVYPLIESGLIDTEFDYVSEDSLAFWYEYHKEFYIAIDILKNKMTTHGVG